MWCFLVVVSKLVEFLAVVIVAVAMSGCSMIFSPPEMVISNSCNGSWLEVRDGEGKVIAPRIDYGQSQGIDAKWYSGATMYLVATGYEIGSNRPLGSASTSVYIPQSSGGPTGPSQITPWQVMYLQTSDPNGGCRR